MARKVSTGLVLLLLVPAVTGCGGGASGFEIKKKGSLANAFSNAFNGAIASAFAGNGLTAEPLEIRVGIEGMDGDGPPHALLSIESLDSVPAAEVTITLDLEPALARRLRSVDERPA